MIPGDAAFVLTGYTTGSFDADDRGTYNSGGGTNHITQTGTGQYRVDVPNLGANIGGDVQVTATGYDSDRCKSAGWGSDGTTLEIYVNCFTATGTPDNTTFSMNYVRRSDSPGAQAAYVWADSPSSASYDADTDYSWNSTGQPITITHTPGSNYYQVNLAGQDMNGGTVEVTAYGDDAAYCKVASWGGTVANVLCFDGVTGAGIESAFDLIFSNAEPNGTPTSYYAWANQPSTASYNPDGEYSLGLRSVDTNSTPSVITTPVTIWHQNVGNYGLSFPDMLGISGLYGVNVAVTGYSWTSDTCKLVGWGSEGGTDAVAVVNCFDWAGNPVDAYYTITFSSLAYTIG